MAGKPKNRLELRRQYEAAEDLDPVEDDAAAIVDDTDDDEEVERKPKKKKAPAKSKAKTTKAVKPAARMRIVWNVVSDAFKTVATFDFAQKAEAEVKAEELNAKGKGTYFVQKAKEPMPDDAPGLGASITRTTAPPPKAVPDAELEVDTEPEDEEEEIDEDDDDDIDEDDD
ncbi:hypothetical protein [Tautonia rosea]|uniref:hypothetical protein n=1 Tax=Tautonia rosea TaxID=2728037 RepID=UPI0014748CA0|nr:hypothetical protein [Tautonia rosea]